MRRRRISVEGGSEKIAVPQRPTYRQIHGKRSNPYSTTGLDKFESVYGELSARRQYVANKLGVPEAMVRFVSSEKGWIPIVIRARDQGTGKKNSSGSAAGVSILGPVEKNNGQKDRILGIRKDEGNEIHGEFKSIPAISMSDERSHGRHSLVIPLSRFLKNTAFWVLAVSAMWVKFIVCGASYFAALFRNPMTSQEAITEQEDGSRGSPRPRTHTVSAPTSPLRAHGRHLTDFSATASPKALKPKNIDPENKHHDQPKAKKYRRVVSMDNRTTRPERSDSFKRSAMADYGANVGATVMITAVLCFIFYGQFCAIFFIFSCLYLFTMLRESSERMTRNNNSRLVDLQSNEYRTKLIVDSWSESIINRRSLNSN